MAQCLRRLAECDDGHEDEADDQHPDDHLLAFLGGVFGEPESDGKHGATLPRNPRPVRGERPLGGSIVGWLRAERDCGGKPGLGVAFLSLGAHSRADGDQLGELRDGVDASRRRDAHEAVCVEIVPEQQRELVVGGLEQPRAPVVAEVPS